jgi:hypothetical protein
MQGDEAMKRALVLIVFALAACGGSPAPVYGPPPPPPVVAPSVPPSFVAAFASPAMAAAGWCEEQTPVPCSVPEGTIWASFNRPGNAGQDCGDPNPNACYSVSAGVLVTRADDLGFPLTTVPSFDRSKTLDFEAVTSAEIPAQGGWCGVVNYSGEKEYEALYWQKVGAGLQVHLFRTRVEVPLSADVYPSGSRHTLGIEAHPDGTVNYKIDGQIKFTETAARPIGPDTTLFTANPHAAIFSGGCALAVYSLTVTEEP